MERISRLFLGKDGRQEGQLEEAQLTIFTCSKARAALGDNAMLADLENGPKIEGIFRLKLL